MRKICFLIVLINSISPLKTTCEERVAEIKKANHDKLTLARKKQSKCNLLAFKEHWTETEKVMQREIINHLENYRQQIRLDQKLCEKIEKKYLPFALDYMVPDSLQCEFNIKG